MPIDVLMTEWETIKERLLLKYGDPEVLLDVLGLSSEALLDGFQDLVYDKLDDLDVTTEMDYSDDNL